MKNKIKVLMVGPARDVKGGMTTVVDNYFLCGLNKIVDLKYIESINDKNIIKKFLKEKHGIREFQKEVANCDIVHIHMASRRSTFRKIKYLQIAKKNRKSVIIHIHGGGFKDFFEKEMDEDKKKYIIENLNKADTIIALSEEWREYFSKLFTAKIVVLNNAVKIPNGVVKKEENSLLFLGRLVEGKGIYDLLSVMPSIIDRIPDVRLYIAGSGEDDKVRRIIDDNNLSKHVITLGWVDKKKKEAYLKETTFFVLPSYREAMPMSLLESMSYGCIPIVTKVGSVGSVVTNEKNGFLIIPKNTSSLEKTIIKALSLSYSERREKSHLAKEVVKNKYDEERMMNKLISLYELIQNNQRA